MGVQPLYIIKISNVKYPLIYGYYASERAWQYSPKDVATKLTHKEAHAIMGRLKRLGFKAVVEPA